MKVIGIDPGQDGGIAVFTMNPMAFLSVIDMPVLDAKFKMMDIPRIVQFLCLPSGMNPGMVFIEKAQCMPRQGVVSVSHYMQGYGEIIGMLKSREIPYKEIPASTWKRALGLGKNKDESVTMVQQKYPFLSKILHGSRGGKKDGKAEAILIALYGMSTF